MLTIQFNICSQALYSNINPILSLFRFKNEPIQLSNMLAYLLAGLFGSIMELSWKLQDLSLCRKIFEHWHFVQNFPPVPEMLSKIQSDPSPLGYSVFQMVLDICNFDLCYKIIEPCLCHCHCQWATGVLSKLFGGFL